MSCFVCGSEKELWSLTLEKYRYSDDHSASICEYCTNKAMPTLAAYIARKEEEQALAYEKWIANRHRERDEMHRRYLAKIVPMVDK